MSVFCNNCGKQVKECARWCNNCGNAIKRADVAPAPRSATQNTYEPPHATHTVDAQNSAARFCPKCGNSLKSGAAFCNDCGYSINDGGANLPSQFPAQNVAQMSGAIALKANNIFKQKKAIIIAAVAVLLLIVGIVTVHNRQEAATRRANIEAERSAIESALHSYERAMTGLNFSYADTFCVPGGQVNQRFLDGLPAISIKGFEISFGGILQSAGILLNSAMELLLGAGYEYNMDFSRSDINITGDRASVKATISVPLLGYSKNSTISMRKIDGDWLIENIS